MGEVWLAEDTRLGRRVALKRLTAGSNDAEARRRLLNEARAAGALTHPNVAGVYDVVEADDGPFIVMEYVEGESLDVVLRRGPLAVPRAVEIGLELSAALHAAHARGIVHRDLKPSNVRLAHDGHVKVVDFGLAHAQPANRPPATAEETQSLESSSAAAGTPAYMAPEVFRGVPPDPASDVYSLGVVLFELLAGQRPFQGATALQVMADVLSKPAPSVRDVRDDVPVELSTIVARCLSRNPTERPGSAQAVQHELALVKASLDRELRSGPGSAPGGDVAVASPRAERGAGTASSRRGVSASSRAQVSWRRLAPWTGLGLVVIAALAVWAWRADHPAQPSSGANRLPVIAVAPFDNVGRDAALEPIAAGSAVVLISSLGAVRGLQVLSRDATIGYRDGDRNVRKLLADLSPTYVVDATLQRAGTRVRAAVSLVDSLGTVVWSGTYDGSVDDPFGLQERLAEGLAQGLVELRVVDAPAVAAAAPRLHQPPTGNREAFAEYQQARAFLERPDVAGNLDRAMSLFTRAVERDPSFALAHAGLGEAYWAQYQETNDGRWPPLAVGAVSRALALDPGLPQVRISYGRILSGSGRRDEAATQLRIAIADAPGSDDAYRELGDVLESAGKVDEAVAAYREAIARRPGYWRNHSYLGALLYRIGRHEEAIAAYERVIALQPDSARGHNSLGAIYASMGRTRDASAQFERALQLEPSGSTYSNAGTVQFWGGRYEEARQSFEEAVRLRPNVPLYRRNLGDVLAKLGRPQEARRAWTECVRLCEAELSVNATATEPLGHLAVCQAKLGRHAEAGAAATKALALAHDDPDVLYEAAVVSALGGQTKEGVARLLRALDEGVSAVRVRNDDDLARLRELAGVAARLNAPPRKETR
jgi:tetratricopeptide (TPR) repeat protein/TolB-like protein